MPAAASRVPRPAPPRFRVSVRAAAQVVDRSLGRQNIDGQGGAVGPVPAAGGDQHVTLVPVGQQLLNHGGVVGVVEDQQPACRTAATAWSRCSNAGTAPWAPQTAIQETSGLFVAAPARHTGQQPSPRLHLVTNAEQVLVTTESAADPARSRRPRMNARSFPPRVCWYAAVRTASSSSV
jgi:hypothetical protein